MMIVSTNLAVWEPYPPLLEGLKRLSDLGFRGASTGVPHKMEGEEREKTIAAYGKFDILAAHASFKAGGPLCADPEQRRAKWDDFVTSLERSAAMGMHSVEFHPGDADPSFTPEEADRLMEELMRRLDEVAVANNIWACWETGTGYFHPNDRFELIRKYDLKKTGICLDTGHVVRIWRICDAPTQITTFTDFFHAFGDLIQSAHIHDWQDEPTNVQQWNDHNPVGQGIIDWEEVFGGLVKIGYTNELCMEYHPNEVPDDPTLMQYAQDVRDRIRQVGGEVC